MDALTGKPLSGTAHLQQSLADIIWTLFGSRVGRREYGSLVPELIDQAMNPLGKLRLVAAIAAAIARWETRLRLTRVWFSAAGADGQFTVEIEGERTDTPPKNASATDPSRFSVPLRLIPA